MLRSLMVDVREGGKARRGREDGRVLRMAAQPVSQAGGERGSCVGIDLRQNHLHLWYSDYI